jgi:enterochelin esterase-like enzyme
VGLTGQPLMLLLIGLTVAVIALVAWVTPRVSGAGAGHAAARFGLLAVAQVVALLLVLDVLNIQYDFFLSWGDLLGTSQQQAGAGTFDPAHHAVSEERVGGNRTTAAAPRARRQAPDLVSVLKNKRIQNLHFPAASGRLQAITVRGEYSGISSPAYVYLPPQYFQPTNRTHRFPVILSLTGYPGDAVNTITRLKLPEMAASLIAKGTLQPTIFVMMRSTVAPPRDTECTDVPGGPQAETFFASDVPRAIKSVYRVSASSSGWGIQGDSTGGYCAMKLAMMYPGRYSSVISLAGDYHAAKDFWTKDLYGGSVAYRKENDLIWRLQNLPMVPVNILLTSSQVGESDYSDTLKFLALAKPPMVTSSIIVPVGGHHFSVWQRELPPALQWVSAHLKAD